MKKLLLIIYCLPTIAFAFFCPNSFSQIDMGNTIDQVKQACGKPDKEETTDAEAKTPQEWTYYSPQPAGAPGMTTQGPPAMLKTTINLDKDGSVIYIGVNGVGVGSSNICGNTPIQLGQKSDQIKATCGKPQDIAKPQSDSTEKKSKITTLTYGSSTLVFTDGVLTGK